MKIVKFSLFNKIEKILIQNTGKGLFPRGVTYNQVFRNPGMYEFLPHFDIKYINN